MYNVKDDSKNLIVSFEEQNLSSDAVAHLKEFLVQLNPSKRVGIDLGNLHTTQNEFFHMLKELSIIKKVSLFNVSAETNILLFLMNYNKYARLYSNENDFKEAKRELVKRNFKFCPN